MSANEIQFIPNHLIDRLRWDECIAQADNGLIYGHSFFLDCMAPGWHALADADYNWVLPVTHNKKFGIRYLYQPHFTQQLGLFSKKGIEVPFKTIVERLQVQFKFWEVNFNYATEVDLLPSGMHWQEATNFILDLTLPYEIIKNNYCDDLLKNLKKAGRSKLEYCSTPDFKYCIELYRQLYGNRMPQVKPLHYAQFTKLCTIASNNNQLLCRQSVNENNEILATALLLYDGKRLYNMANSCTEKGKKSSANHFLINAIIHEFSGNQILFDFEGSDIAGVKSFYENFGGKNQPYYKIRHNNLPSIVKIFKR